MEPSTENQHHKKGTYGFTHMKPSNGNQHRKKKPMQAYETMRWKPVCGNQHNSVKKKLPSWLLCNSNQFTASQKAPLFVPQCELVEP